jgi:cysteine desulfurase/selenocysteine lyase
MEALKQQISFDPIRWRADFPILQSEKDGKPLTYLDSAATSQKPQAVIDALQKYYLEENANIHRGVYYLSQLATQRYEETRLAVARIFHAPCARGVIFTRGTTESINLVAQSWGRTFLQEGDEILLNRLEHHSNLVPWQMLAAEKGVVLKFIPLKDDATLDLDRLDEVLTKRTKLLAVAQMSNVTGSIHPIKTLIREARKVGALTLVDGAQGACHAPVNIKELDADFYAFSAHKMLGPTGVGVLIGREDLLNSMPPWHGGGDMIATVHDDHFTVAELPSKFEAGTPNIAGIVAFKAALDYLQDVGMENIAAHEAELTSYAIAKMDELPWIRQYGPRDGSRGGVCSFTIPGVHPHDVGTILDEENIAIRAGHHCAQPWMRLNKIPGTNRASFYFYNTKEDVDRLIEGLAKVRKIFNNVIEQ